MGEQGEECAAAGLSCSSMQHPTFSVSPPALPPCVACSHPHLVAGCLALAALLLLLIIILLRNDSPKLRCLPPLCWDGSGACTTKQASGQQAAAVSLNVLLTVSVTIE